MTVKEILTPVINEEFAKYVKRGYKIKLKSVTKRRVKYTLICGFIAFLGLAHPVYMFIAVPVYISLMMKTRNRIEVILSLAKKSPNKPIELIVAEEMNV